jgi:sulfur carrier protein
VKRVRIIINGEPHTMMEAATVADVIAVLGAPPVGVAVAVDGEVVPRASWSTHQLPAEARVEVLTAVQGG